MRIPFTTVAILLLLASCRPDRVVSPSPGGDYEFSLRLTERVVLENGLQVEFQEVLADSRCPSHVVCVWEGEGRIRLRLAPRGYGGSVDLSTHRPGHVATARGYQFTLLELDPYPEESGPIPESRYRARLRVTKL